jgi:hypothetical protein
MKSTEIVLGEKSYTVTPPPLRLNITWQRHVATQAKPLLAAIPGLMAALAPIIKQAATATADKDAPATSWLDRITDETLPALLDSGSGLLIGVLDALPVLLDLIYEFDPALNLDKEHIEANATEEELLAAFVALVKLSFPFGTKWGDLLKAGQATMAASGDTTATTTPSLRSASGDAGMTSLTRSRLPA